MALLLGDVGSRMREILKAGSGDQARESRQLMSDIGHIRIAFRGFPAYAYDVGNYLWTRSGGRWLREKYLTIREFAESWGVDERTVRRWIVEGLKAYKYGDRVWFTVLIPQRRGNEWVYWRRS